MRRVLMAAALALITSAAHAGVLVSNGDFQAPLELGLSAGGLGDFDRSAVDWIVGGEGRAGTWEFGPGGYSNAPAAVGDRIGFVSGGSSIAQVTDIVIGSGFDYKLSALVGQREDQNGFEGMFGFFADDPNNIIGALTSLVQPASGVFSMQMTTLFAVAAEAFAGQRLGVIFLADSGQVNFDNVSIEILGEDVMTTPVPGAAVLFLSAIAGGGFGLRRKKASKA